MSPGVRKAALSIHLVVSIGWIGTVLAYLALAVAAAYSAEPETVQAAWIGMELTGWWVIVPLAVASLLTGLLMSLGTPWGLFRHYWVVVSLALTVLCVAVVVVHMPGVSATVGMLRDMSAGTGGSAHAMHSDHVPVGENLLHPGVGLLILLAITVLNIYKPRGLTPYGWRKQQEERAARGQAVSRAPYGA
jgi:hypothetical protein